MMKVGLHVFQLWGERCVGVSRVALLMGGIVAPITCQCLLLICTFINEDHLQPGNRWYLRTVFSLAVALSASLAIGATTLSTEIPRRSGQVDLGSTRPARPIHGRRIPLPNFRLGSQGRTKRFSSLAPTACGVDNPIVASC
jgi:hypothetical protein